MSQNKECTNCFPVSQAKFKALPSHAGCLPQGNGLEWGWGRRSAGVTVAQDQHEPRPTGSRLTGEALSLALEGKGASMGPGL